jgi:hypothetical protein
MAFVLALMLCASCRAPSPGEAQAPIDLLRELPNADIRPTDHDPRDVVAVDAPIGGRMQRGLSASVPTRVTFALRIPPQATFSTTLAIEAVGAHPDAAGVAFRLGISDERLYEPLFERFILARDADAVIPIHQDLSRYGGWQWSLFYRPSRITWKLVLNTAAAGPGSEGLRGVWGAPTIEGRPQ